ncbi:UDP-glycosyltransferase 71K2-like [Alnus glutinosa]|uniref:UDP-glycosyltransferase 71K2-like n=1 Tax=Alnus glutinosa TaxID=3517 RepID=UPI002D76BD38|nr:UDP-glycosyltransferase 71K2-like [Alnus glutinosa]
MRQAELVFIPTPGMGHLVSTLEFAKRLLDRDDRLLITVLSMKFPSSPVADAYTRSLTASQARIQVVDLPQVDPPPSELLKSPQAYRCAFIESNMPNVKHAVTKIVSGVAALVLDFFCMSMIDVGRELGLPSYLFFTSNAGFLGLMLYLPTRHNQANGAEFSDADPELLIPGFVNAVPAAVMPSAVFNKDGGYAAYIKLAQRFRDTKGIIVNTFRELEQHGLGSFSDGQTPPVYPVGPVLDLKGQPHPGLDRAEHENIMRWLDFQSPSSVVFLCFGSMGSFSATQVKEIAIGLERSGQRFLWSLRPPGLPPSLPSPDDILPEGFLERIEGRGMICRGWAPQVEVLAHKAVGGFVSHCGWNSILESLWHGVPIVTWPIYAEQQLNAFEMVRELGLAMEMRLDYRSGGDLVMAEEIERAVSRLMDGGNEVRKKVKEMGEMARKAVMDGGSSFTSIGQLIEDMIGSS